MLPLQSFQFRANNYRDFFFEKINITFNGNILMLISFFKFKFRLQTIKKKRTKLLLGRTYLWKIIIHFADRKISSFFWVNLIIYLSLYYLTIYCARKFQNFCKFHRFHNYFLFPSNARIIRDIAVFSLLLSLEQTGTYKRISVHAANASCSKVRNIRFPGEKRERERANLDAIMGRRRAEAAFNWTTSRRH